MQWTWKYSTVETGPFRAVMMLQTLGFVLCCSLLSSLSLCSLSYSSRISAGVLFLSTTYTESQSAGDANTPRSSKKPLKCKKSRLCLETYLPAFHLQPFLPKDVIDSSGMSITQHWAEGKGVYAHVLHVIFDCQHPRIPKTDNSFHKFNYTY